jgi:hypothetical protein
LKKFGGLLPAHHLAENREKVGNSVKGVKKL